MERYSRPNELCHYGVLGMKWGQHRSRAAARVLGNHRRNVEVKKIKDNYDIGKISKAQKKALIKNANAKKKSYLQKTKKEISKLKTEKQVTDYQHKTYAELHKETKHGRASIRARQINRAIGGIHIGTQAFNTAVGIGHAAVITSLAANPITTTAAGMVVGTYAAGTLAEVGIHKLIGVGIDKLS